MEVLASTLPSFHSVKSFARKMNHLKKLMADGWTICGAVHDYPGHSGV